MHQPDCEGQPCAMIMFDPCPGRGMGHRDGGCPNWVEGWHLQWQEDGQLPQDIVFRGCQLQIFLPMMRGVAQTNTSNAAAVESLRNEMLDRTSLMVNLARAFVEGRNGLQRAEEEPPRLQSGPEGSIEADN